MNCGQIDFLDEQILVETQQVAQLVAQPIEVVEYHRPHGVTSKLNGRYSNHLRR